MRLTGPRGCISLHPFATPVLASDMTLTPPTQVDPRPGSGPTPLFLAPQAGVSESPFRRLCRDFGADVVVTEFVSADGVVKGNVRTKDYLRFDPEEHPIGVQIFGADPAMMAE